MLVLSACHGENLRPVAISDVASQTGDVPFALKLCAASSLLFEGGSKPVGILNEMQDKDLEELLGGSSAQVKSSESVVVWAFELVPETIQIGSEQATIVGRKGEKNTFYFTALPKGEMRIRRLFSLTK